MHEAEAIKKIKEDPKQFFKYANKNKKTRSRIGPLKSGLFYYSGAEEMARILSEQYKSVFSPPKDDYSNIQFPPKNVTPISDLQLNKEMFQQAMRDIKPSSAPGPDGVPAYLYHTFVDELADPVMKIWRESLDTGVMPDGTSLAIITPIPKAVDKSIPANYRPVSLTNHLTKIFERVLRKAIVTHMEDNYLMNKTQHGFRQGLSTVTQILTYYDSILSILEEGFNVDSVYLDFAKAFDKVDHTILLKKVESLGITGKILGWIKTFLTNRKQQVRVEDILSPKEEVKSGVPQGSVLGPLLFLIMMLDITEDIKHSLLGSYADDTRLWRCINGRQDQRLLQEDLNSLYKWADSNNMEFNGKKFEVITFGKESRRNYKSPDGKQINRKETLKDLGIHMSSTCDFKDHIDAAVKATQKMSSWVLRTFRSRGKLVMRTLLTSIIIPKIEYGSILWSPTNGSQINLIENVQRRFTSRVEDFQSFNEELDMPICNVNYWDRLKDLKLYSLERRRERFIILYIYRFIIGLVKIQCFEVYVERGIKVKRKFKQTAPATVRKLRQSSFFYRGPQLYCLLPEDLRQWEEIATPDKTHVMSFKAKLDKYLADIPDQPTTPGLQREAETNSLVHQIPLRERRRRDEQ